MSHSKSCGRSPTCTRTVWCMATSSWRTSSSRARPPGTSSSWTSATPSASAAPGSSPGRVGPCSTWPQRWLPAPTRRRLTCGPWACSFPCCSSAATCTAVLLRPSAARSPRACPTTASASRASPMVRRASCSRSSPWILLSASQQVQHCNTRGSVPLPPAWGLWTRASRRASVRSRPAPSESKPACWCRCRRSLPSTKTTLRCDSSSTPSTPMATG
mmetsp:Transcript_54128/g.168090  ORF Transcript_54128/g.168090 Transcript_54128/m.168090 type:complete len:216 (-) Transcript_54128:113-760(-)